MHSKKLAPEQKLLQDTNPPSQADAPREQPASTPAPAEMRELPIGQLREAPWNARKYYSAAAFDRLTADIKTSGLLQPLIVREVDDAYEVIAGSRRYRACKQLGWTTIPATTVIADDKQAQIMGLTENLNRDNLNPYEQTLGIIHYFALEFGSAPGWPALIEKHETGLAAASWVLRRAAITHVKPDNNKASEALGVSPEALQVILKKVFGSLVTMNVKTFADNHLRLLKLRPELREALDAGKIDHTSALLLHRLKPQLRAEHLAAAINEKLTVKELKARITNALGSTPSKFIPLRNARKQLDDNWRRHKHLDDDQLADITRRLDELAQILAAARPQAPTSTREQTNDE